jgi:hypothetical protein
LFQDRHELVDDALRAVGGLYGETLALEQVTEYEAGDL